MAIEAIHHHRQHAPFASQLLSPVARFSRRATEVWRAWRVRRKTEKALAALPPHLLRDIHGDNELPLPLPAQNQPLIRTYPRP